MSTPIGFIGIGIMGSGMAANLVRSGHNVVVWNRTRSKAEAIGGASVADTPGDLLDACDLVMICVADTPDVVDLFEGEQDLLGSIRDGHLIIDHSTISPSETIRLAAAVAERGGAWIDAPVSGGSEGAERGTLSVMIGGAGDDVARALPFLQAF